jgi:hypothetical protein
MRTGKCVAADIDQLVISGQAVTRPECTYTCVYFPGPRTHNARIPEEE